MRAQISYTTSRDLTPRACPGASAPWHCLTVLWERGRLRIRSDQLRKRALEREQHGGFARYQLAHVLGHPKLREAAIALSGEGANMDPKAYLLQLGFALPDDATVDIDPAASDTPHSWHLCIAGDDGTYHCVHLTLPEITVTH